MNTITRFLLLLVLASVTGAAHAQSFPSRPLRIIVGFAAGGPSDIVSRLHQEIVHALTVPQVKEQIARLGMEAVGSTPDQFGAFLKDENVRWSKVVRDLNLRAQ